MKIERDMIALVVDGSRLLLLRNTGDHTRPTLQVVEHHTLDTARNRELLADAPGSNRGGAYPRASTYGTADPHQRREDAFGIEAARALDDAVRETPGPVVVVAPPHMLGVLRRHYSDDVRAHLVAEVYRDLTKAPVEEIAQHLAAHTP